jgi:hypothetical protein
MNKTQIDAICREVYRRFPDFKGVAPKVQPQPKAAGKLAFLLTFNHTAALPGSRKLSRWVRVVADENARIVKITTSR